MNRMRMMGIIGIMLLISSCSVDYVPSSNVLLEYHPYNYGKASTRVVPNIVPPVVKTNPPSPVIKTETKPSCVIESNNTVTISRDRDCEE